MIILCWCWFASAPGGAGRSLTRGWTEAVALVAVVVGGGRAPEPAVGAPLGRALCPPLLPVLKGEHARCPKSVPLQREGLWEDKMTTSI